jgi:hypothetical protein
MRKALAFFLLLALVETAYADDAVTLWGNYYKERSTRVIEPIATVTKDLPSDAQVSASYLVDQITSASVAAGVAQDQVFSEYRQEVQVSAKKRFEHLITPGALFRFSHEPDYQSIAGGGELALALDRDDTVLRLYSQFQDDDVYHRFRPGFHDKLYTTLAGVGLTQVLLRNLIGGASLEAQFLHGYIQNPYRMENHPRTRNRYSVGAWLAYQYEPTRTTGRIAYRFYRDTWQITGHTLELEATQRILPVLSGVARFRWYGQDGAYFDTLSDGFFTTDPKLFPFTSRLYGAELRWTLAFLDRTALDAFKESQIVPSYAYLDQNNAYGPAHIIQLGWYWPY